MAVRHVDGSAPRQVGHQRRLVHHSPLYIPRSRRSWLKTSISRRGWPIRFGAAVTTDAVGNVESAGSNGSLPSRTVRETVLAVHDARESLESTLKPFRAPS